MGSEAYKEDLLTKFQDMGCFLIDTVYVPVDKIKTRRELERVLLAGISSLVHKVEELQPDGMIVIKSDLYAIAKATLIGAGYEKKGVE